MKEKSKKVPPSRARYNKAHPTLSCRVTKEMYDDLERVREKEGKSLADVIKIGLGRLEVKASEDDDIRNQGIEEGFGGGYRDAKNTYMVEYPCSVCGGMIVVSTADEKETIMEHMVENNWGHKSCHEQH